MARLPISENFYLGSAIDDGNCFFDSFRQSLEQQRKVVITAEQLRQDCIDFASNNPPTWFTRYIATDGYEKRSFNLIPNEETIKKDEVKDVGQYIQDMQRMYDIPNIGARWAVWGTQDLEGRILCKKYGVELHVTLPNPYREGFMHQLVSEDDVVPISEEELDKKNKSKVLHIMYGNGHFEPLLDINKHNEEHIHVEQNIYTENEGRKHAERLWQGEERKCAEVIRHEQEDRKVAERLQQEEYSRAHKEEPESTVSTAGWSSIAGNKPTQSVDQQKQINVKKNDCAKEKYKSVFTATAVLFCAGLYIGASALASTTIKVPLLVVGAVFILSFVAIAIYQYRTAQPKRKLLQAVDAETTVSNKHAKGFH